MTTQKQQIHPDTLEDLREEARLYARALVQGGDVKPKDEAREAERQLAELVEQYA